jgi:hypothetical protein
MCNNIDNNSLNSQLKINDKIYRPINSKHILTEMINANENVLGNKVHKNYKLNNVDWRFDQTSEIDSTANKILLLETLLEEGGHYHPTIDTTLSAALTGKAIVSAQAYNGEDSQIIYDTYVNPSNFPKLDINFEASNAKLYTVSVYDGNGREVWRRNLANGTLLTEITLSTGSNGAFNLADIIKNDTISHTFEFINAW